MILAVAAAPTVNAWGLANVTLCRYSGWRGTTQWLGENTVVVRQYNDLPDAIVSRYGNMTVIFLSDSNEGPDYSGFEATFKAVGPSNSR